MKIVLAGSPELAVKTFTKIINHFKVVAIITQPDKPQGRGLKLKPTAVSNLGLQFKIPVFKPHKIIDMIDDLAALQFDLLLTFAFGQYIPSQILKLGTYPPLNIHGSLLPKYRGAAPIQGAILNNDSVIGITLMEMTTEMDGGNVYFQAQAPINEFTTTGCAVKIVEDLACDHIIEWLDQIEKFQIESTPQGEIFSLSPKIKKADLVLTENLSIQQATRKIRAYNPNPGAYVILDSQRIKIYDVVQKPILGALKLDFSDGSLWAIDYQYNNKTRQRIGNETNFDCDN